MTSPSVGSSILGRAALGFVGGVLLVVLATASPATPVIRSQQVPPLAGNEPVDVRPERPPSSVPLASGALRSAVELMARGQAPAPDIDVLDGKIRVEVLHDLETSELHAVIAGLGGTVEGGIERLVQALVPFGQLVALERHDGVRFVRPPVEANVPLLPPSKAGAGVPPVTLAVGQEVGKTNADAWHAAGHTGSGVKVGIVDVFDGTLWSDAVAAGELPTAAGTFCRVGGAPCDIWTVVPGADHGEGVAEIINEMAPDAELYLATVNTVTDLQAAVDFFDSQGVDIISRSLTARYDGPGDGTGPLATVIDKAVADGIVWFNSAGNGASDGTFFGQYWRGEWADADGDGWIEFAPGDELLGFGCAFSNGVRWSDFGAGSPTDYDVCVFDNPGDAAPFACSFDDQTTGAPPLELAIACTGDVDYLAINLLAAGNGTSGDILEFMTNMGAVEHWQNPYSASGPASDTASPGGLSVGAVDPSLGTAIAPYSSQGPSNDERTKPDISAAACVDSFTFAPDCFAGTSAATPAVAGAAALIIGAGEASTPAQVKTYLLNNATVDRGDPGADNVFGAGELILPAPPAAGPAVGLLRVVTSPAVQSLVSVDGTPRNDWGLDWLELASGTYQVSFSDVPGFFTPAPQAATVVEGATTQVTGVFSPVAFLRVTTASWPPGETPTISVDGEPMNTWGLWLGLPAGSHTVSFEAIAGLTTPCERVVTLIGGATTHVEGDYSDGSCDIVP